MKAKFYKVTANCPQCGAQELAPFEISLIVFENASNRASASFTCIKECGKRHYALLSPDELQYLQQMDVEADVQHLPAEVVEDIDGHEKRPGLGVDEVLDFKIWLDGNEVTASMFDYPSLASPLELQSSSR